MPQTALKK